MSAEQRSGVEQLIEDAKSSPECFKCGQPITRFVDVRIITVWVDGKRRDVWCHAAHAKAAAVVGEEPR